MLRLRKKLFKLHVCEAVNLYKLLCKWYIAIKNATEQPR